MPARQFFTVLNAAKKIEFEKTSYLLFELVNIGAVSRGDVKWIERLRDAYKYRFMPEEPKQMLDNETAGKILTKIFGGN